MQYSDLYGRLIILTKRNDITHTEIGRCINLEKGAVTARAKRNADMKDFEIEKIENAFGVKISEVNVCTNTLLMQNTAGIDKKLADTGIRLSLIQEKNNLSNRDMAELLGIFEYEYAELKESRKELSIKILNRLKQSFDVSVDNLLYGS